MTIAEFDTELAEVIRSLGCWEREQAREHCKRLLAAFEAQADALGAAREAQYNQALDMDAKEAELAALRPLKPIAEAAIEWRNGACGNFELLQIISAELAAQEGGTDGR